jgi:N-acetylmuramate 1-kinase
MGHIVSYICGQQEIRFLTSDSTLIRLLQLAERPREGLRLEAMPGGGSERRMTRLHWPGDPSLVLVENPRPQTFGGDLSENDSFVYIAGLLAGGGWVPAVLAFDREAGSMLVEDLGDRHLLDEVREAGGDEARLEAAYRAVLEDLAQIQALLRGRFDPDRVHNPPYDRELMRVWESGYARQRFFSGLLELPLDAKALDGTCDELADRAAGVPGGLFLYRDFQSTNVMRCKERWRYIDFQGGRLGPPQYDAASLLLDPYARLPRGLRRRLLEGHARRLQELCGVDAGSFLADFPLIAVHRMLQALGAYGLLSRVKGKWWFLQHVPAALEHLGELLEEPALAGAGPLRQAWEQARRAVDDGALDRLRSEAGA